MVEENPTAEGIRRLHIMVRCWLASVLATISISLMDSLANPAPYGVYYYIEFKPMTP